jgi:hypothetical protein
MALNSLHKYIKNFSVTKIELFFLNCEHYGHNHFFTTFSNPISKNQKSTTKTLCRILKSQMTFEKKVKM